MKPDPAILRRLQRLERVREVARRSAAMQMAEAEGTLGQLLTLRDRTREMAGGYRTADAGMESGDLRRIIAFVDGVGRLTRQTEQDIDIARSRADARRGDLLTADRRLSHVSERVELHRKALSAEKPAEAPARRRNWHGT